MMSENSNSSKTPFISMSSYKHVYKEPPMRPSTMLGYLYG